MRCQLLSQLNRTGKLIWSVRTKNEDKQRKLTNNLMRFKKKPMTVVRHRMNWKKRMKISWTMMRKNECIKNVNESFNLKLQDKINLISQALITKDWPSSFLTCAFHGVNTWTLKRFCSSLTEYFWTLQRVLMWMFLLLKSLKKLRFFRLSLSTICWRIEVYVKRDSRTSRLMDSGML